MITICFKDTAKSIHSWAKLLILLQKELIVVSTIIFSFLHYAMFVRYIDFEF